MPPPRDLEETQYRALADLRHQIRRFLVFSETAARHARIEPRQHQLLLVLRALPPGVAPTIGAVAERLQIRHNSAVDLVKRSVERGLVERRSSAADRREAALRLTPAGRAVLRRLSIAHRAELESAAPALLAALRGIVGKTEGRADAV